MIEGFDPGALLARSYELPRGPRVCLRLARVRDLGAIEALVAGAGIEPDALELARLVRGDPRQRVVICATALVGSAETLVGVGGWDVGSSKPTLVIVDESATEGLVDLLAGALAGRVASLSRARAA